jgi:hypothetical protein
MSTLSAGPQPCSDTVNLLDGCVGVGLPQKRGRNDPEITLNCLDGRTRAANGWDELRQLQESGQLPEGAVATTTVLDDTLPGGPRKVERRYTAPFALANREENYKIACKRLTGTIYSSPAFSPKLRHASESSLYPVSDEFSASCPRSIPLRPPAARARPSIGRMEPGTIRRDLAKISLRRP